MPFPFSYVCDLLQQVSDLPPARRSQRRVVDQLVHSWFSKHRRAIDQLTTSSSSLHTDSKPAVALLSTLLPERRPDRVYALQARGLQRIIIRALGLGRSRVFELGRWERPSERGEAVDLAACVEEILQRTPNPTSAKPVTVEEIDAVLHTIAARCRFSAPSIQRNDNVSSPTQAALGGLYRRLDACGAKWLTRLILKDFRPVVLEDTTVARAFHPALPMALQVHASLETAVASLPPTGADNASVVAALKPTLGVEVGRKQWLKGRSIQHCIAMVGPQRVSCERKMDGEYVQVHVDLRKSDHECLQLFSKSGKDSTWDRIHLHDAIRASLRLGRADCKLTTGCILEGEMLAYDEREGKILNFDAVRKHVNRSGSNIFNTREEVPGYEHLMIVYYDAMLIDDESLLGTSHAERFRRLEQLVDCRAGHAELVQREVIDFGSHTAAAQLREAFARCITARLEGLVVKPENDPYFNFAADDGPTPEKAYAAGPPLPHLRSCLIKLKKEYIGAFGEVGDFAVVGARYDATKAMEYPADRLPGRLRWTHFFIGCLKQAESTATRPRFVVTNVVTLSLPQMVTFITHCRPREVPYVYKEARKRRHRIADGLLEADHDDGMPFELGSIEGGLDGSKGGPTVLFADPPVVDIRCFSFHRQGYGLFWSPRFPSVVKFHFDRTFRDAITFEALQDMAEDESARRAELADEEAAEEDDYYDYSADDLVGGTGIGDRTNNERAHWVDQLKKADQYGIAVDAETSQSSGPTTAAVTVRSQSSAGGGSGSVAHSSLPMQDMHEKRNVSEIPETDDDDDTSSQCSGLSIATVESPVVRRRQSAPAAVSVIDLTGDDDEAKDNGDEAKDTGDNGNASYNDRDSDSDSDESQRGIAQLFAQEEARLLQASAPPAPSLPAIVCASPRSPAGSGVPSSPTNQAESSQISFSQVASQGQQQTTTPRRTIKRLGTWDVSSMYPAISPPQLKRARSGM